MKVWDVNLPTFRACKVYDDAGAEVRAVFRVEFDGDGDEGMATVSRYEATVDANGGLVVAVAMPAPPVDEFGVGRDGEGNPVYCNPVTATERRWVKVVPTVFQMQADKPVELVV